MLIKKKNNIEIYKNNFQFDNNEKHLINELINLKNTSLNIIFFQKQLSTFLENSFSHYKYNLKNNLIHERIDIYSNIIKQATNLIIFVFLIIENKNIGNIIFTISLINNIISNNQNIFIFFEQLPELNKQNQYLYTIINFDKNDENKIKISKINSIKIIKPKFKSITLPVDLEINDSIILIGPSGIGKTSLM